MTRAGNLLQAHHQKESFCGFYALNEFGGKHDGELLLLGFAGKRNGDYYEEVDYEIPFVKRELSFYNGAARSHAEESDSEGNTVKKSALAPSMLFARLSTPDDYYQFACSFGTLFGSEGQDVIPSKLVKDSRHGITREELLSVPLFSRIKRPSSKLRKALIPAPELNPPCTFEFLSDWIGASSLMKFAYHLMALVTNGFKWVPLNKEKDAYCIYPDDYPIDGRESANSENTFTPLIARVSDDCFISLEVQIDGDLGYLDLIAARQNTGEIAPVISDDSLPVWLKRDFSNPVFVGKMPSTKLTDDRKSKFLVGVLDCLCNEHFVNMAVFRDNGKIIYSFDSLLSSLWFDFMQASLGGVALSTCDFCGRPFFRNNRGHKKRFCSDTCRKNFYNREQVRR